jgi:hypothetical protein
VEETRLSAKNQASENKAGLSQKRTRMITLVSLAAVIASVGWYFLPNLLEPSEKPFVVMKAWSDKPAADGQMSPGYAWLHRQCHENLVDLDKDGRIRKRGAGEISRTGPRIWSFSLRPDSKWSDDGKPVTVQDYVRGWDLRQGVVLDQDFKRIKNLKSIDATTVTVELSGDEDAKSDHAALSSIWLSAIKSSTAGQWNLARELEGPCDGPYVVSKLSKDEAKLNRNKHWYAYNPEMIKSVRAILDDGSKNSPPLHQSPNDLFTKGLLSFVEPSLSSAKNSSQPVAVNGRVFLEPEAHYLIVNPRGLLGGDLTAFAHAAINRGELSALISRPKTLSVMYRMLPLSFAAYDDAGQTIYLPPHNLESVADANKLLGFTDAEVRSKIPAPFKRKLVILGSSSPEMEAVPQRFSDRLGANYNITGEVLPPAVDGTLPATWDVAFIHIDLTKGVSGWASQLVDAINKYAPGRTELANKLIPLVKDKSTGVISKNTLQASAELDSLTAKSLVVVPLGQLGAEILLEDGVMDVSWIGDSQRDPDVSRAKRIRKGPKG